MGKYKFSKFFHVFVKGNQVCLYNALTMETYYTSFKKYQEIKNQIENNKNDEFNKSSIAKTLLSKMIIVSEDFDEINLLNKIREKIFNGVNIRVMVLQMTDFCNLKCKYCFIEGGQPKGYQRQTMNTKVARAAINKFFDIVEHDKTMNKKPTIVFYGGEPLSNWDVIKYSLAYIKKKEKEKGFFIDRVVITNGTLITEEIAKCLKKNNVLVSVSMDGLKEIHDANRIDYNNHGSFDKAVEGLKILQNNDVESAISCVMAKNGVENCDNNVKFLIEDLGIKGLGFNHVSIIPGLNFYDKKYEEDFADAIIKVQELIQKKYPEVYERRMGHKVNSYLDKRLIKSDCTGCGEQISVSPNGQIGICQGYMGTRKTFNHTVFEKDFFPSNDPIFIEWSNRSPLNMEVCLKCSALATCGGGCPRNADMINGSIWEVDSAFCHFAKKAQNWLIWQKEEK